jgi:flagellin-like protein
MFVGKKGETGIGTLIIFIAMILVAAIAASVLIQTATSLQNKALLTGERTKAQVSSSALVLLVYAEDGSTNNDVDDFFIKLKLAPGSDPMKLNDTLIEFDLSNQSADLDYVAGTCVRGASGYWTNGTSGNFTVEYLVKSNSWREGYLQGGDILKICFQSPTSISSDEDISIRWIPKVGNPTVVETALPDVINQKRIYVFP